MESHILVRVLVFSQIFVRFCYANQESFIQCMSSNPSLGYIKKFDFIHSRNSLSYRSLLQSAEQNPRWINSTTSEPELIITPYNAGEIRTAITCSKKHGFQLRIKSGGHDYEGLSYTCKTPYVLVDLVNLRSISIHLEDETAWVQTGATLGELYYNIAQKSKVHAFPAGLCPSVGVGGHISGGGLGTLVRKNGLAADNVIDAYLMNADGEILDRKSMGEDLFWAIRGGGGASFGIILAWRIKLVRVPETVTVFTVKRKLDGEAVELVGKWQHVASRLPENLFIRVVLQHIAGTGEAIFNALFLGNAEELLPLMKMRFPELGVKELDCIEMSWIESAIYFAGFESSSSPEVLLDRIVRYKSSFKAKSDFVQRPLPESALSGIIERLAREDIAFAIMDPFGGKMDEIGESESPFPHRKGNLLNVQYLVKWDGGETTRHVGWIDEVYGFMEGYVSSSPRGAYLNYRDLDLGFGEGAESSYSRGIVWGRKYFKGNFERLVRVKTMADPHNFFRHQQSIPMLLL
ncbi:berberine bridge enzyme-like 23 [Salvia hispanica]|uniref:berberine bridge enzyme-like 23 n=1 Tax=Salvia hispanica TaxID=49212 RepID=UPI002009BE6B|nr:berberine bridge enzyme-like 23 [Salvia hispanica]